MSKTIVCRCEDVTEAEVRHAIDQGLRDLESLKRYLAVGTGPCQGKNCLAVLAHLLAAAGVDPAALAPITGRPPLIGAALGLFAGDIAPRSPADDDPPR